MTTQYKSEKEADKDQAGVTEIMTKCTLEAMGMGTDKPADVTTPTDTPANDDTEEEKPADSTGHE